MTPDSPSGAVRVRLFAAAGDVVGADELTFEDVTTAGEMLDELCRDREPRVRLVLAQCSLLVDGERISSPDASIHPGSTVDVLPPFAGG